MAVFDREALLRRLLGDVALLHDVLGLFLGGLPALERRLHGALASGDRLEIARAAHSLRGSLLTISAGEAAEEAARVEAAAKAGQVPGGEGLDAALAALRSALAAERGTAG